MSLIEGAGELLLLKITAILCPKLLIIFSYSSVPFLLSLVAQIPRLNRQLIICGMILISAMYH